MLPAQRVPVARDVMKRLPAVRDSDTVIGALQLLRSQGVVVKVDDEGRPFDILTLDDLDRVRKGAEMAGSRSASARLLFSPERRYVHSVREDEDLGSVVRIISANHLPLGIVAIDERGRYAGYVFNADLREQAETFVKEAVARAEVVQKAYPEAWAATGAPPPSSVK